MMTFLYFFSIVLFLLLCTLLCGVILIQESKSTGLGASFGGDSSDSVFGASTADVLKKFTGWLAVAFMVSCIVLSVWTTAMGRTKTTTNVPYEIEQVEE